MSVASHDAPNAGPNAPRAGVYVQALRAYSFPASVVSVLLGSALAARGYAVPAGGAPGAFAWDLFLLTLAGALLAHAGGNVLNDYYDFGRGVDTKPEHGSGVLPAGLLTGPQMGRFGWALIAGAGVCGVLLLLRSPGLLSVVAPLALLGLACAVLYTPLLKRYALGDVVIMTSFGVGLTLGAYGVQTPFTGWEQIGAVALASAPLALLVDAILHANNMRDVGGDTEAGYRTVASLLGPAGSRALYAVLLFGPVALVALGAVLRLLPWASLAVVLALPPLVKAYRTGDVPFVAQSHLLFGLLYVLPLVFFPRP